jgi:hypothetical protein
MLKNDKNSNFFKNGTNVLKMVKMYKNGKNGA